MKKLGLSTRVFIGFGLGILLGVIFGEKVLVIKIIGDIFLKLIKMLTVPLVFFSIISGITNLTDVNKLKRVGAKILGMYVVTTLLAGFIGLGIAHLINPGVGFQIDSSAIGSYEATAMNSVSDTLLAMVPDNIINAMANTNMMGIIIFCAIFGCAMVMLGTKVSVVKDFIVQTTDIMYKMTAIIMETSPFGVCALMDRSRSHGFSSRKRMHVSNVAPPHASMAQYPTRSILGRIGSMSPICIRVAQRLCWPSRMVVSMI